MRAARGAYAGSSGLSCTRRASTTCPGTARSSWPGSATSGGPRTDLQGDPRRHQAGRQPGHRHPGQPRVPGPQSRSRRPAPDQPGADRARPGRGGGGAARGGRGRPAAERADNAGAGRGDAGRAAGAVPDQDRGRSTAPPGRPDWQLRRFCPIFPVRDLAAALDHYASLGFAPSPTRRATYGFANRERVGLHLEERHVTAMHGITPAAYLYVRDADAIYQDGAGRDRRPHLPGGHHGLRDARGLAHRPGRQPDASARTSRNRRPRARPIRRLAAAFPLG